MKKLSIIIPVYNVENYIGKCLESCLNQDIPKNEYEIIVVNDGTKDNSVQVIEKYITPENNIRLIHRKNGGLSAARNTGLKEAKGEYVWFVDSDDWIENNVLYKLYSYLNEKQLDVLCFNRYKYSSEEKKSKLKVNIQSNIVMKGIDFLSVRGISPGAWCAIYNRTYLENNHLLFMEGVLHEDQEFTPRAFCLAKRISFINICAYYYFQRQGSIMRSSQSKRRCEDLLKVAYSLFMFSEENCKQYKKAHLEFKKRISFIVLQSVAHYNRGFFPISDYKKYPFYPLFAGISMDCKLFLKCLLFNISPSIYITLYNKLERK